MTNPYLEEWLELHGQGATYRWLTEEYTNRNGTTQDVVDRMEARRRLTLFYAWAVPTEEAVNTIAELSPILEVGAGKGYWAHLIAEAGADILAYDIEPGGRIFTVGPMYFDVQKGGVHKAMAKGRGQRTLFLCWPPYGDSMAVQALKIHKGEYLAYIGEGNGGCTGDDEFHDLLEDRYEEVKWIQIPQWYGVNDYLSIYQKK